MMVVEIAFDRAGVLWCLALF